MDYNKPVITDAYADYTEDIRDNQLDISKWLEGVTPVNPVNGIKRYNSGEFEYYSSGSWLDLPITYLYTNSGDFVISNAGGSNELDVFLKGTGGATYTNTSLYFGTQSAPTEGKLSYDHNSNNFSISVETLTETYVFETTNMHPANGADLGESGLEWGKAYIDSFLITGSGITVSGVQSTISDTDSSIPTSGAVVDYVAGNPGGYITSSSVTFETLNTNGDIDTSVTASTEKIPSSNAVLSYAAPINHASAGTGYGVATGSAYGHVKTSTGITNSSGVITTSAVQDHLSSVTSTSNSGSAQLIAAYDSSNKCFIRSNSVGGMLLYGGGHYVSLYDGTNSYSMNIFSGVNQKVTLNSNGESYFNGGNVGFGTDSPTSLMAGTSGLAVHGSVPGITFSGTESGGARFTLYENGGALSVYKHSDSSYPFYINPSGNVGIGTANPEANLHIGSLSTTKSAIKMTGENAILSAQYSMMFTVDSESTVDGRGFIWGHNGDSGSGGFDELMRLDADTGNVGIGTASPGGKLHVISTGLGAGEYAGRANGQGSGADTYYGFQAISDGANTGTNIGFYASATGGSTNYAAVFQNGNVGIGTASPSARLHALATTEQLRLGYDSSHFASHTITSAGDYNLGLYWSGTTGAASILRVKAGDRPTLALMRTNTLPTTSNAIISGISHGYNGGSDVTFSGEICYLEYSGGVRHIEQRFFADARSIASAISQGKFSFNTSYYSTYITDSFTIAPISTTVVSAKVKGALSVGSYTVAGAPSASTLGAGAVIYVSNGAAGNPVLAFSDGTNWLRCDTLATISSS